MIQKIQKRLHIKALSPRATERLSAILRTIPPATAILLLVAFAPHMEQISSVLFFAGLFLLAALATFAGERRFVTVLQQAYNQHYAELQEPCRAFLDGKHDARVVVTSGKQELIALAETVNQLLEKQQQLLAAQQAMQQREQQREQQQAKDPAPAQQDTPQRDNTQPDMQSIEQSMEEDLSLLLEALEPDERDMLIEQKPGQEPGQGEASPKQEEEDAQPSRTDRPSQTLRHDTAGSDAAAGPSQTQVRSVGTSELEAQLLQLIEKLTPVIDGDLRIRLTLPDTMAGVIADTFNSFIEELAQFVKWTRYASQTVSTSSHALQDHMIEATKGSEDQMHSLAQVTDTVEEIASRMQHLSDTLRLNVEVSVDVQKNLRAQSQSSEDELARSLADEMQRKVEMLETALTTTEELATRAEGLIGELYTVAQQVYQSSAGTLKSAKRLGDLETLAERWLNIAAAFTLAEEPEEVDPAKVKWLL